MKRILLVCLAALLWSCDTPRSYGPDTPYYRFPAESRLVLNQALEIPANWATARIQNGRVVPFGHVQEQLPHCIFEINTVRETPQQVEPDSFAIVKVTRSESTLAANSSGFFFFIGSAWADVDRPSQMFYKTVFTLRSERQPGVLRLTCQSDQYAAGIGIPRHLTVPEIRQALGNIFTLELPGPPL
jgi:hypothetical protein